MGTREKMMSSVMKISVGTWAVMPEMPTLPRGVMVSFTTSSKRSARRAMRTRSPFSTCCWRPTLKVLLSAVR